MSFTADVTVGSFLRVRDLLARIGLPGVTDEISRLFVELSGPVRAAALDACTRGNAELGIERVRRWQERANAKLAEMGLELEAERLRSAGGLTRRGSPMGTVEQRIREMEAVLISLREDMQSNPAFWRDRMRTGKAPSDVAGRRPSRATIFLGHGRSPLWTAVERHLEKDLGLPVQAWESEERAGEHVVDVLNLMLDTSDFAVIVVTAEDRTADGISRARQNVVHEIGLFQGRLRFNKVALLVQDGVGGFSNNAGLQYIPFAGDAIHSTFGRLDAMLLREELLTVPGAAPARG